MNMKSKEGIINLKPKIKKVTFEVSGKMNVWLEDGRSVIVPLKFFPSIQKLTPLQRKKHVISDGEVIIFDDCDEVYHIEQILGRYDNYKYRFAS